MSQIRSKLSTACSLAAVIAVLLLAAVFLCFDFTYDLNDDSTIRDIASGMYTGTPDGHNAQMLYPLGWLLALCYRMLPAVPWFACLLIALTAVSITVLIWAGLKRILYAKKRLLFGVLMALGFAGLWIYEMVFVQYTAVTGLCMMAATVLVLEKKDLPAGALSLVSCNLRSEMMLFLVPLLIVAAAIRFLSDRESITRRTLLIYAAVILVIGAFFAADAAAYADAGWSSFRRFFDARTTVYDYAGVPSYDENKELYDRLGAGPATVRLLDNYNFELSDAIDADFMESVAVYAKAHEPLSFGRKLYLACYTYGYRFVHGEEILWDALLLATYLFCYHLAARKKDAKAALLTLGLFALRSVLWIFLLYMGRIPERITHPFYLTEWILLLGILLHFELLSGMTRPNRRMLAGLLLLIGVCGLALNGAKTVQEYKSREERNAKWDTLRDAMRADEAHFYLLDVYSTVAYSEKMFTDEPNTYHNYDCMGGWFVKSPASAEKRARFGFSTAAEGLLSGKAYFVSDHTKPERDPAFIRDFFAETGKHVRIDAVKEVSDFTIYQIIEE
ncbi:MAG: hypothetical protein K5641_03165 [Lachnospiraceae bacterium]|nr:hypothetical protein [Lachnospiraceae bacterium]